MTFVVVGQTWQSIYIYIYIWAARGRSSAGRVEGEIWGAKVYSWDVILLGVYVKVRFASQQAR